MAVTPNYSWPIPVATDYVKDGWDAIADLGNAIDTTVATLGSGLTHINTTTFTTSSTVAISNVFSSTYDNYRVIIDCVGSTSAVSNLRFRTGSSDDSNALYNRQYITASNTSVTAGRDGSQTEYAITLSDTSRSVYTLDIANPNLATKTGIILATSAKYDSGTNIFNLYGAAGHNSSTQFTGFSFFPSTGTYTGTIRVYGYQN